MRPARLLVAGVVVLGVAFVLFWFQPQKLWIDERVDSPPPTAAALAAVPTTEPAGSATAATAATAASPPSSAPPGPVTLARGSFVSRDHGTSGSVVVLQLADGQRFVRLEGLATDNGPDLYLYLSTNPAAGPEGAFDDSIVNLGRLQGNLGDQNYALPDGIDLAGFASVVIWCDRFDSAFGAADLGGVP